MEIKNTSKLPLKVPLPAGKRLFLKPGEKSKILNKSADHPPVKKLIDEGVLEVLDIGGVNSKDSAGGSGGGISGSQGSGGGSGGGMRHTGDR